MSPYGITGPQWCMITNLHTVGYLSQWCHMSITVSQIQCQGSPFPIASWPGASKTTSWASGFEQIFLFFHISRSKNFEILEVGLVMILRKGKPWVFYLNFSWHLSECPFWIFRQVTHNSYMVTKFFTHLKHDFTRLGRVDWWLGRTLKLPATWLFVQVCLEYHQKTLLLALCRGIIPGGVLVMWRWWVGSVV